MAGSAGVRRGIESFSTTANAILLLHRRTFYRTVKTKDAAVARLRAEQRPAVGAFVEKLACVGRHLLSLREAADRTHEDGLENNFAHYTITCGPPKDNPRPQSLWLAHRDSFCQNQTKCWRFSWRNPLWPLLPRELFPMPSSL